MDFGAALRRRELVGLALGDLTVVSGKGLRLLLRRSKTDQRGAGQVVAVWASPTEPVCAHWPPFSPGARCGSRSGRLFIVGLSDKAAWRLVQQAAQDAGGRSLLAALAAGRPCHCCRRGRRRPRPGHAPDPTSLRRGGLGPAAPGAAGAPAGRGCPGLEPGGADSASLPAKRGARRSGRTRRIAASRARNATSSRMPKARRSA